MAMFLRNMMPSADKVTGRLFYTDAGQTFVSALFGLALATLFRRVCKGSQCRVVEAAPVADVEGKVFRVGDKCYTYKAVPVKCEAPPSSQGAPPAAPAP
jgi:hypothetical protein